MHSKIIIYSKAKNAHHASAYLSYLFDMKKQFFVGKKHIIRVILTMTLDNQGGTTSLVIWHILIHNLHCLFCGSHLLTSKNIHGGKIRKTHNIEAKIFSVYTIEKIVKIQLSFLIDSFRPNKRVDRFKRRK